MTQKVRKILIMVVMAALIICLMAASLTYTFTYGRYAGGKFDDEKSPYGDLIEFVGANQYTVRTPEELIQAIEDGYSNIKIADDAEEPFVIDTGVTDVSANLVLDVNGKTLIRNSRNPMLDVQTNVSVVLIYDSSDEEQGGFYNPVGSALQASGGTLTVGSGNYDDGPKKEEYNEYNGINSNHGTLDTSNSSVTLYARDNAILEDTVGYSVLSAGSRADTKGYGLVNGAQLPKINTRTVPGQNGAQDIVYGNIYLDNGSTLNTNWLPVDTFLLYTIEKDCFVEGNTLYTNAESQTAEDGTEQTVVTGEALTVACDVASCDFYYYYSIGDDDGDGYENYAVIYGYWDVKALARDDLPEGQTQGDGMATALKDSGLIYPYGAVRMVEGEGFARGGQFSNNFGTVNSYGIYANGGALTASGANFTTGGEGVCIRCEGSASLSIGGGTFSSEIGNTIEMSGGTMNVTAGTFTKSAAKGIGSDGDDGNDGADQIANQTAIIDIEDGTLKIEGKSADSVKLTAGGAVKDPDGTVTYSGTLENVFGIRAEGGTVTTSGCTFNISGDYSAGVLSYNGEINLGDDTSITVTQSETATVLTSAGVSSEQASGDGEHPVNLSGDVTITSNGLGITARGTVNVTGGVSTVTTSRGTGIYVNNGSFTVGSEAAITVNSTVKSGYSWANPPGNTATNTPNIYNGVYVQGGSLVSEGTLNVTFTGVENEARNVSGNDQIVYNGENTSFLNQQTKSYAVRVEAGTGTNTNVTIDSGNITNTVGGGVLVNGGKVTLGTTGEGAYNESTKRGLTVQTTGTEVNTSLIYINGMADNWAYYWNMKGGDAVKVDGGDLYVYGGKYTAAQGNGILTRGGTANIFNGIFTGGYNSNYHATTGAASTYSFKAYGGTVKISGGDFNSEAEGAFVMGTSDDDKVTITGGSFQADGPTAFATWNGATVEFDDTNSENKITVSGESTGLTVEQVSSGWRSQNITIKSATFKSTNQNQSNKNGIWYGNGNAKLTISGGSFTGTTGSGLSIGETPNYDWNTRTHNIQLSGGSFKGGWNAPISNYSSNYLVSGAWTSGNNTSGQTFYIYS